MRNLLLIFVCFFSIILSFHTEADIFENISIIPVSERNNFVEFQSSFLNTGDGFLQHSNGSYKYKNLYSLGFINHKNNFSFNFEKKNEEISQSYRPRNIIIKNKKIKSTLYSNKMSIFGSKWMPFSRIGYQTINYNNFYCIETEDFIMGSDVFNCNEAGKKRYIPQNNNEPTLILKGEKFILSTGIKNTSLSWNDKKTFFFELETILNNYKNIYSTAFDNSNISSKSLFYPNEKWIDYNFKTGYKYTRKFNKLSVGLGLTSILKETTSNNSLNKNKNNVFKLETSLSSKISKNTILNFSTTYFKNENFLEKIGVATNLNNNVQNLDYSEMKLSFIILSPHINVHKDYTNLNEKKGLTNFSSKKIQKSNDLNNKKVTMKNEKPFYNSTSLIQYAFEVAKNNDISNKKSKNLFMN